MIHSLAARRPCPSRSMRRLCGLLFCVLLLSFGCARPVTPPRPSPPPPPPVVEKPSFEPLSAAQALERARQMHASTQGLRSWRDLEPGLKANLAYVSGKPAGAYAVERPGLKLTWGAMRQTLEDLLQALPYLDEDPALLAQLFAWFPLEQNTQVTGYYEPLLEGSLEPDPRYPYPLYRYPPDLLEVDLSDFNLRWKNEKNKLYYRMTKNGIKPYFSREDIDFKGALKGRGLELAWVKDRVDLYFLQIQGSGRLLLPDGATKRILYANKNGRDLHMLGGTLINRGYLTRDEASAPRIKQFVRENPQLAQELLAVDKSYVFFRLSDVPVIVGAMNKPLTPMSSIAVDPSRVPLGATLAMSVPLPVPKSGGPTRLSGLMMAQDTGGAIKGNHVDLFFGFGAYADFCAGRMNNPGQLHILVSRRAMGLLPAGQQPDALSPGQPTLDLEQPGSGQGSGQYGGQGNGQGAPAQEHGPQ